jgi:hypothetical protein
MFFSQWFSLAVNDVHAVLAWLCAAIDIRQPGLDACASRGPFDDVIIERGTDRGRF